jgi:hypothetical protein
LPFMYQTSIEGMRCNKRSLEYLPIQWQIDKHVSKAWSLEINQGMPWISISSIRWRAFYHVRKTIAGEINSNWK